MSTAPDALTVGAVDAHDATADFSSRGPTHDGLVKPEIAAPGVDISAALSSTLDAPFGTKVDQYYTRASGTSMAAPHVAGAAAILAEKHPDWTAADLKSALVGASKNVGGPVNEQGAGRLDVPAALGRQVIAQPAALGFGVAAADSATSVERNLTDRNDSADDVTLRLSGSLASPSGRSAPTGTLQIPSPVVVVPAHGSVVVPLVVHPKSAPEGRYQGVVTASSADLNIRTPIGFSNGPVSALTTFRVLEPNGNVLQQSSKANVTVMALDRADPQLRRFDPSGQPAYWLPTGSYFMTLSYWDYDHGEQATWMVIKQEVRVAGDGVVVFDTRDNSPVVLAGDDPMQQQGTTVGLTRTSPAGQTLQMSTNVGIVDERRLLRVNEVGTAAVGTFGFEYETEAERSQLDIAVGATVVHARYATPAPSDILFGLQKIATLPGRVTTDLVWAGTGSAADISAAGPVGGKVLLVGWGRDGPAQAVENARAAGAAAILIYTTNSFETTGDSWVEGADRIPVGYLARPDGDRLRAALPASGRESAAILSMPNSPYSYHLSYPLTSIGRDTVFQVHPEQLARVDTNYHASEPTMAVSYFVKIGAPASSQVSYLSMPAVRADYYGPATDGGSWQRALTVPMRTSDPDLGGTYSLFSSAPAQLAAGHRYTDDWLGAPLQYGQVEGVHLDPFEPAKAPYLGTRTATAIDVLPTLIDSAGHDAMFNAPLFDALSATLIHNGTPIAGTNGQFGVHFGVPAESGRYQLGLVYRPDGRYEVDTTWDFESSAPSGTSVSDDYQCWGTSSPTPAKTPCAALPLLAIGYDLGTSVAGSGQSGRPRTIAFRPHRVDTSDVQIADASLSVSDDGGRSWHQLSTIAASDGWYRAAVAAPKPGGTVSRCTTPMATA